MAKETKLDSKIPGGAMRDKWTTYQSTVPLVSPNNKRRIDVIIVGSGLAGASAAASLGELGYNVKVFTFHDSPRRAHSLSLPKVASTPPKITATTVIRYNGSSMKQSKAATTAPARPMYTDWQKPPA